MGYGDTLTTKLDEYGHCPNCNANWDDGDILVKWKNLPQYKDWTKNELEEAYLSYSPPRHFSRLIGIEYPEKYDGIWEWMCPDCKTRFPRFKNEELVKQEDLEFSVIPK